MNIFLGKAVEISPQMVRRSGGGWLAKAQKGAILSLGVTAATEEQAREKFRSAINRWVEILESRERADD